MKRRGKQALLLSLVFALLVCGLGCQKTVEPSNTAIVASPSPTSAPEPQIGVCIGFGDAFETAFVAKMQQLAEEKGYALASASAGGDLSQQKLDVETMLAKNVKVLIIRPVDLDGLQASMDDAQADGVCIINLLEPINGLVNCLIAPDYSEMGAKAARLAKEAAKDHSFDAARTFLLEEEVDSFKMQLLHDGFLAEAKKLENVSVTGAAHLSRGAAASLSGFDPASLAASNVAFIQNDAAARALAALETAPEAKLITIGGEAETIALVEAQKLYASLVVGPGQTAQKAMEQAAQRLESAEYKPPQYIGLDIGVVSKSSVSRYTSQNVAYAEPA